MALFGKKEEKTAVAEAETKPVAVKPKLSGGRNLSAVIKKPRITEKAVRLSEQNVYTFEIDQNATKFDVRDAVKELFNVTPVKVRLVTQKARTKMSRAKGKRVKVSGLKKAYVYLKAGDRIDVV